MATLSSDSAPPDEEFSALSVTCIPSATVSSTSYHEVNGKGQTLEIGDGEMNPELWNQLPDALLDKIFARLTFHVLFQTRVLSKKWAVRIARCRAFQDEVSDLSSRWESYCPLFWSWSCEWLIGYNRLVNRWQKLFPISYFPGIGKVRWLSSGAAGSLLCFHQGGWSGGDLFLHVTNPLLRIWNKLPTTSTPSRPMLDIVHIVGIGSTDYKVIVVTQDDRTSVVDEMYPFDSPKSNLCAEIYSPGLHRWATDAPGPLVSRGMRKVTSAYFDGMLYFVLATSGFRSFTNLTLFAYEVGRGTWITVAHPFEADDDVCQCGLVVCQSKVLLVLMQSRDRPVRGFKLGESVYGPAYIPKCSIQIFEIIAGSSSGNPCMDLRIYPSVAFRSSRSLRGRLMRSLSCVEARPRTLTTRKLWKELPVMKSAFTSKHTDRALSWSVMYGSNSGAGFLSTLVPFLRILGRLTSRPVGLGPTSNGRTSLSSRVLILSR